MPAAAGSAQVVTAALVPAISRRAALRCGLHCGLHWGLHWGLTWALLLLAAAPALACFSVVVGRDASTSGAVLLGHNEQNGGAQYPNLRVIPPLSHAPGATVTLRAGGRVAQVAQTHGFIWSELPAREFSDSYMNEWGVAVVSDGCPTREYRADLTDGGIGYMLRRLVAERARTAREGVHLAGQLVEQVGYSASGRTLVIAGPREAWLMSLVKGRRWVARRVPDDGVVLLPNVHIITAVDLADTLNYLGSPDVIDYAVERGWHDPDSGRPFSFRAAYNSSDGIDARQRQGQRLVLGVSSPPLVDGQLPFAVIPQRRLGVADVIAILRDHGSSGALCSASTQEGSVFELRADLPPAVGCVYWRAAAEPCTGLLVPWYAGITATPPEYFHDVPPIKALTAAYHFSSSAMVTGSAWSASLRLQNVVNGVGGAARDSVRAVQEAFESGLFRAQPGIEARALALHDADATTVRDFLTAYSADVAARALALTAQMRAAIQATQPMPTAVTEPASSAADVACTPSAFALGAAYPNPFNHQVHIPYRLSEPGPVELMVYDLTGQRLARLVSGPRAAGDHVAAWDGRDQRGRPVATGTYFLHLRTETGQLNGRVLLLR